jgi:hypothetical protein
MTGSLAAGSAGAFWLAGSSGLARIWYTIDTNALLGACAGAVVFALHEGQISGIRRILLFVVSLLIGYLAAAELDRLLPIQGRSVCAFIGAALAVAIMNVALDTLAKRDLFALWHRLRRARRN